MRSLVVLAPLLIVNDGVDDLVELVLRHWGGSEKRVNDLQVTLFNMLELT
jgi:hypothetical protein